MRSKSVGEKRLCEGNVGKEGERMHGGMAIDDDRRVQLRDDEAMQDELFADDLLSESSILLNV